MRLTLIFIFTFVLYLDWVFDDVHATKDRQDEIYKTVLEINKLLLETPLKEKTLEQQIIDSLNVGGMWGVEDGKLTFYRDAITDTVTIAGVE